MCSNKLWTAATVKLNQVENLFECQEITVKYKIKDTYQHIYRDKTHRELWVKITELEEIRYNWKGKWGIKWDEDQKMQIKARTASLIEKLWVSFLHWN